MLEPDMAKDPVHHDVMTMLVALAHKPDKDAELRRIRFEATLSACRGQIDDHPYIALTWLWKLHQGITKTRQATIRKSCRAAFRQATRQSPEQAMLMAVTLLNQTPAGNPLQKCAVSAFTQAFDCGLRNDPRTDRIAAFTFKAIMGIDDAGLGKSLKRDILHRLIVVNHGIHLPVNIQ